MYVLAHPSRSQARHTKKRPAVVAIAGAAAAAPLFLYFSTSKEGANLETSFKKFVGRWRLPLKKETWYNLLFFE